MPGTWRDHDKEDWFLPSKDDLNELYKQKNHVGITTGYYWASTQSDENSAYGALQNFASCSQEVYTKVYTVNVRAVRAF